MHPFFAQQVGQQHHGDLLARAELAAQGPSRDGPPWYRVPAAAVGRVLVRVGGHLAAGGRPDPVPCPWCDGAFPAHRHDLPADSAAGLAGLTPAHR